MPSYDPWEVDYDFATDVAAQDYLNAEALQAQFNALGNALVEQDEALARVIRDDDTLHDALVRARHLHPELVTLLAASVAWQPKQAVACATTANITLSGEQTIDGVSALTNARVLVKNQTDPTQNGIYVVSAEAWARAADADTGAKLDAAFAYVTGGTANAGSSWVAASTGYVVASSAISFVQVSGTPGPLALVSGGTGSTTAAGARLGLGITAMDATVVAATLNAARTAMAAGTAMGPVMNAANLAASQAAFGVSPFGATLIDDADATAARRTVGINAALDSVLAAASISAARIALGFPSALSALWTAANAAAARIALGAGTVGAQVFTADTAQTALSYLGLEVLNASEPYTPGQLANGQDSEIETISVPGARAGDFVLVGFTTPLQGQALSGWVASNDSVAYQFQNNTANTMTLGSGTVKVRVFKA